MTNRTFLKKVTKNPKKPQIASRDHFQIVKHFEPTPTSIESTNLRASIPILNNESDNEENVHRPVPKRVYAPLRKPIVVTSAIKKIASKEKPRNSIEIDLKNPKILSNRLMNFQNSSSSSFESKLEKYNTRKPLFRPNKRTNQNSNNENVKSARERSAVKLASENLKSVTDPSLLQKELNLKALKEEIYENQRINSRINHSTQNVNDHQIENLRAEIIQSKTDKILHKKILIRELRSEIAQYRQFNNFHVYNSYESSPRRTKANVNERNQNRNRSGSRRVSLDSNEMNASSKETKQGRPDVSCTGTEKESIAETQDDGPQSQSSSTSEESIEKPMCYIKLVDDDLIKQKIEKRNKVIHRVMWALRKIKEINPDRDDLVLSSCSSDIEETIQTFEKETAELMRSDSISKKEKSSKSPSGDKVILNETFTVKNNVVSPTLENTIKNPCQQIRFKKNMDELTELEKSKIRKNDTDYDFCEMKCDKFRNIPEMDHVEQTSSFEELQMKLQTISETAESNSSTPRKKSEDILEVSKNSKFCDIDSPKKEHKEVQVSTETCAREDKAIETLQYDRKNTEVQTETFKKLALEIKNIAPEQISRCKTCDVQILPVQAIRSRPLIEDVTCHKCQMKFKSENVPGISIASRKQKLQKLAIQVLPPIVIKPAMVLKKVLSFSINPNGQCENRMENSKNAVFIQISTNSQENYNSSKEFSFSKFQNQELVDEEESEEQKNAKKKDELNKSNGEEVNKRKVELDNVDINYEYFLAPLQIYEDSSDTISYSSYSNSSNTNNNLKQNKDGNNSNDNLKEESNAIELPKHEDSEKPLKQNHKKKIYQSSSNFKENLKKTTEHSNLTSEDESEFEKRMLVYKSFHIYDNPNRHDPGLLDKNSMEKLGDIDSQFYKMFINPDAATSKDIFAPDFSKIRLMGCDSKMVQVNSSMLEKETVQCNKQSNIAGNSGIQKESIEKLSQDLESKVSVFQLKPNESTIEKSILPIRSNIGTPKSYESPSEITVTISYSESSEEKSSEDIKNNTSEVYEEQIKIIDFDWSDPELFGAIGMTESKEKANTLTIKDKKAGITNIRKKLKNVDVNASLPFFSVTKDNTNQEVLNHFLKDLTSIRESESTTQLLSNQAVNDNNSHINFVLDQRLHLDVPYEKHLELSNNGRYKDEEDLFVQLPHTLIREPEPTNDIEVTLDKFKTIPKQQLKNYSQDMSHSDTVTSSNSVSEGEILCTHSVSNGEIHICHPQRPLVRNILTRKNNPQTFQSHSLVFKKFDLNDPNLKIERKRNYFNNWITYYVTPSDRYENTVSSYNINK
ncbi:hypothetical protein ABEB36_004702 [Hypothenemus hampei]|uniref:Uncharacterized protein n=1 Tax=Hypothenemus hampei TaxID=57062 RepID=A0ABD1F482_HYPHA